MSAGYDAAIGCPEVSHLLYLSQLLFSCYVAFWHLWNTDVYVFENIIFENIMENQALLLFP